MIQLEKVEELKDSMDSLMRYVDRDEVVHTERFLGMETNFKLALRIALLVAVSFVPNLFHKVSKYINQMT
jgi:hypothetical protein